MSRAAIDVLELLPEAEGLPLQDEQMWPAQPVPPELVDGGRMPAKHIGRRLVGLVRRGRSEQETPDADLWFEQSSEFLEASHPFYHDNRGNVRDGRTGRFISKAETAAYFDAQRELHAAQTNDAMSYEAMSVDDLARKLGEAYYHADQTTAENVGEILESKLSEREADELDKTQNYDALNEIIAIRDRAYDIAEQRLTEMTSPSSVEDAANNPSHRRPKEPRRGRRRYKESIEQRNERRSRRVAAAGIALALGGAAWVMVSAYDDGSPVDDGPAEQVGVHDDDDQEAGQGSNAETSGQAQQGFEPEAPATGENMAETDEPEPQSWEDEIEPGDGPIHSIEDYAEDAGLGELNGAQAWRVYLDMAEGGFMTSDHITGVGLYSHGEEVRYAETGMASFSPEAVEAMKEFVVMEIDANMAEN